MVIVKISLIPFFTDFLLFSIKNNLILAKSSSFYLKGDHKITNEQPYREGIKNLSNKSNRYLGIKIG